MSLPSAAKKITLGLLLGAILLVISPISVLAASTSLPATSVPATQVPTSSYQTTPAETQGTVRLLPQPDGSYIITPGNPASSSAKIQEALSLGDIGDFFKGLWNGITDFAGCIKDFGDCMAATANNIIELGTYIVQHALLREFGGDAAVTVYDCTTAANKGALKPDEAAKCDQYTNITKLKESLANNPNPAQFGLVGLLGAATETSLTMPVPVSSGQYFASINPFAPARADTGYDNLHGNSIILEIWTKIRDAAYALMVVVLVVVGFMVMLRVPLGPRAVITAQNALPRIVVALILITFSFAIAGVMIDLARIAGELLRTFLPSQSITSTLSSLGLIFTMLITVFATFVGAGALIGGGLPGAAIGAVVFLLVMLVLAIIICIIFTVILYKVLSRLVIFILLTMFAPLLFAFGAIPRMEGLILEWFKRAAAAILSIPVIAFVLHLALAIGLSGTGSFSLDFAKEAFSGLAFQRGAANTITDVFTWAFAAPLIGLVLFSFAVKVPELIDSLFDIKPFGARTSGGGGIAGAVVGAPIGGLMFAGNLSRGMSGVRGLATSYAAPYAGEAAAPFSARVARGALRIPGIGTPEARVQAGIASAGERTRARAQWERRIKERTGHEPTDEERETGTTDD